MRRRRFPLGIFARFVYIAWALACLVLGWMTIEGRGFVHDWAVARAQNPCATLKAAADRGEPGAHAAWSACLTSERNQPGAKAAQVERLAAVFQQDRAAIAVTFTAIFIAGLVVFYALLWVVSAVRETAVYQDWFRLGRGGSAHWAGVLAFRRNSWHVMDWFGSKARIFLGHTAHK